MARYVCLIWFVSVSGLVQVVASCGGSSGGTTCVDCDVTGLWAGFFQSDEVSANGAFQVDLVQSGAGLTGSFSSTRLDLEGAALSGTQTGGSISFTDEVEHVQFEGKVTEDMTAEGTYSYPGLGDHGTWRASRVEIGSFVLGDCIDLEYRPNGLAHDGEAFWVVSSGRINRVDAAGSVLLDVERPGTTVGGDPKATFDGQHLLYVNHYEIYAVDEQGREVSHHELDPEASEAVEGIVFAKGELWATEYFRKLHRVDEELNVETTLSIAVPVPGALAYDGSVLWITSNLRFDETPLYGLDWDGWARKLCALPPGVRASDLAYDGQAMWIADMEGSSICRLDPG